MKYLPVKLSVPLARQLLKVRKHSPAIMFGVGMAGAVTSTVLACKATLQLEDILEDFEKEKLAADELLSTRPERFDAKQYSRTVSALRARAARDIVKLYAPAVGLGLISISLLTGAHVVLTRRNAGLTAAYIALDRGFKEYRERVVAEYGEDKDRELRYGTVSKEIVEEGEYGHEVKKIKRNGVTGKSVYAQYYDEGNKHWSNYPADNKAFLMSQQAYANNRLNAHGFLMLNDVYEALGLEKTSAGQIVGWVKGYGDDYVDFGMGDMSDPVIYDFFVNLTNTGVLLDFNVDGPVYELIDQVNGRKKK
jgi:hypothetical protein